MWFAEGLLSIRNQVHNPQDLIPRFESLYMTSHLILFFISEIGIEMVTAFLEVNFLAILLNIRTLSGQCSSQSSMTNLQ